MKRIKDQTGFSLIELVSGLLLVSLIFVILTLSVINFVTTYEDVKLFTQLQDELFSAIETIRYGYTIEETTEDVGLIGLLTANNVEIENSGSRIVLTPIVFDPGIPYYSIFYLDDMGRLKATIQYADKYHTGIQIFPSGNKMIGNQPQFKIINHHLFTAERTFKQSDGSDKIFLLGIELEARVRFREKAREQSVEDDIRINTRTIQYKTSVFIGNAELEIL